MSDNTSTSVSDMILLPCGGSAPNAQALHALKAANKNLHCILVMGEVGCGKSSLLRTMTDQRVGFATGDTDHHTTKSLRCAIHDSTFFIDSRGVHADDVGEDMNSTMVISLLANYSRYVYVIRDRPKAADFQVLKMLVHFAKECKQAVPKICIAVRSRRSAPLGEENVKKLTERAAKLALRTKETVFGFTY